MYTKNINNIAINNISFKKLFFPFIFTLILYVVLYKITKKLSINLIFSDQIDLFYGFYSDPNFFTLFMQQHGPHRQGLGSLIMYPILKYNDWNVIKISYLSIIFLLFSSIMFTLSMLYSKSKNITVYAVIAILLSLGSIELITITPNISHSILPIFFASLIVFISIKYNISEIKYQSIILTLIIFSLFTGFGIFFVLSYIFLDAFYYIFQYIYIKNKNFNWSYLLFKYFLIIVSIGIFSINYNLSRSEGCSATALSNINSVITYTFAMASIPVGGNWFSNFSFIFGFVLIILYLVVGLKALNHYLKNKDGLSFTVLFLVISSLLFIVNASIGRHCLGTDTAYASRYYLFSSLGLVGVFLHSSTYKSKFSSIAYIALAFFVIVTQFTIIKDSNRNIGDSFFYHKKSFLECIHAGTSTIECNKKIAIYPPSGEKLNDLLIKFNQINK